MTGVQAKAVERDSALKLCETVAAADDVGQPARVYASRAVQDDMDGKALVTQLEYIAANVGQEYEQEINELLGVDTDGFDRGYCQICGTRNEEAAHENGMVCIGCYEDVGDPEECVRCGDEGYDGMQLDVIAWAESRPDRDVAAEADKADLNPLEDEGEHVRVCKSCERHY